ncbi:MAG: methylated-DNA--[protein]-cysteine S-methyltransferase [Rikenellaceae bacterium]
MGSHFAVYTSSIGYIYIEERECRLSKLQILQSSPSDKGCPTPFIDGIFRQVLEFLRGERRKFDVELYLDAITSFQRKVFEALLEIPYGTCCSYKEIAIAIGNPNASRAVGMANNKNPILIIIPCHRVVGSTGALVGYAAGLSVKEKLINIESETITG